MVKKLDENSFPPLIDHVGWRIWRLARRWKATFDAEMTRLGLALGARPDTFMGLSGLGDLVLTATGDLSRNRRVGMLLAGAVSAVALALVTVKLAAPELRFPLGVTRNRA